MNLEAALKSAVGPTTFSKCYAQFSENIERLIAEVANKSLLEEHFVLFDEMQKSYNQTKLALGDHCITFAGYFRVFRKDLEKYSESPQQDNMVHLEKVLKLLKMKMTPNENGESLFVVQAIAESSLNLARGLIVLLEKLQDLEKGLQHPHYKHQNMRNIWAGVAGVIGCVAGLILIATPLVSTVPWLVAYGAHIASAGGGIAAAGAFASFQGFAKVSTLDKTIDVICTYVKEKEKELQDLKEPVVQHNASAKEISILHDLEGDIEASSLANYVESFEILNATFLRQDPPPLTLTARVQRFVQERSEILAAMSGAAVATALVSAATTCCAAVEAEFLSYAPSKAVILASVV